MYGDPSDLVFNSYIIKSTRGVKQGDPLVFIVFKEKHPQVDLCAYADDSSLIGPIGVLQSSLDDFVELSKSIGLEIKLSKCFLIGKEKAKIMYGNEVIQFTNYSVESIKFLGTYFGNRGKILDSLYNSSNKLQSQLHSIQDLKIEKYLAFSMLSVCFSSKINHFLRSIPPDISREVAQKFNEIRTKFLGNLVETDSTKLPYHAFFSASFGGVGFSRAEYFCQSAYLGGLKNFLFEFRLRFSDVFSQIIAQNSVWLRPLDSVIQNLSADIWNKCFPKSISSIPDRSIEFLHLSVVKWQNCVLHGLEDLDFSKRLSVTKVNNPVFADFLLDLNNCSPFITQQPRPYGLHLNNEAWKLNMRLRLGLFPSELLANTMCCCDKRPKADFRHIVSCKKFLQFRSILHNAVRDVTYEMFKCHGFNGKIEPLLKHYSDDNITNSRRGDLIVPYLDSCQAVIDFTTVDPCAEVYLNSVSSDTENHLSKAEKRKISTYSDTMIKLNSNLYSSFKFISFAISILGNIGFAAENFFDAFSKLCRDHRKNFNQSLWRNRIVFSLYRSFPKYLNRILDKLYRGSSRVDVDCLIYLKY
ncbi:hypothetical protein GEMRC1_006161 [Eukaryota sp. GEM-RC1]